MPVNLFFAPVENSNGLDYYPSNLTHSGVTLWKSVEKTWSECEARYSHIIWRFDREALADCRKLLEAEIPSLFDPGVILTKYESIRMRNYLPDMVCENKYKTHGFFKADGSISDTGKTVVRDFIQNVGLVLAPPTPSATLS